MNCPQCRRPTREGAASCVNCGVPLVAAQASASSGGYRPLGTDASARQYQPRAQYSPADQYPPVGQQPSAGFPPAGGPYQPQPRSAGAASSFQFDWTRLSSADKIVGIATLITVISIWLPWYAYSGLGGFTFSGTTGHGWLWLEFVVGLALVGYLVWSAGGASDLPIPHAMALRIGTGVQWLLIVAAFADIPGGNIGVGWDWGAFAGLLAASIASAPVVRSYRWSRR